MVMPLQLYLGHADGGSEGAGVLWNGLGETHGLPERVGILGSFGAGFWLALNDYLLIRPPHIDRPGSGRTGHAAAPGAGWDGYAGAGVSRLRARSIDTCAACR